MASESNRLSWLGPTLFGLLSQVLAFLATILVTTAYATHLAFKVLGTPDQKLIGQFAASSSPWVMALVGILLVFVFSLRLTKKSSQGSVAAGIIVGISSAVFAFLIAFWFHPHINFRSVLVPAVLVLISWAGATLGSPRR
jgi:hypothetical protein